MHKVAMTIALAVSVAVIGCASPQKMTKTPDQPRFWSTGQEQVLGSAETDESRRISPDATPRWFAMEGKPRTQLVQLVASDQATSWRIVFDDSALESPQAIERLVRMLDKQARYYAVIYEVQDPSDLDRLSSEWVGRLREKIISSGIAPGQFLQAGYKIIDATEHSSRIVVEALR